MKILSGVFFVLGRLLVGLTVLVFTGDEGVSSFSGTPGRRSK